jgi:hypothetical protein
MRAHVMFDCGFSVLVPFAQELEISEVSGADNTQDDKINCGKRKLHERLALLAAFAVRRR